MEGGRGKATYEGRVVSCPLSTASANDKSNEAVDEEAQIEEFFELMRRIRELRKELRMRSTSPAKRGRWMDRQERKPWTPVFEMEDFAYQAKEAKTAPEEDKGGGGRGEEKGKKRRRTEEEEENEEGQVVSTGLNLGLGL